MSRVRYETYCGGRLLKVTELLGLTGPGDRLREGSEFWDGRHYWKIDEAEVADDVAQAMLASYGEHEQERRITVGVGDRLSVSVPAPCGSDIDTYEVTFAAGPVNAGDLPALGLAEHRP